MQKIYYNLYLIMKHFWTHKEKIPEGQGYGQFSPSHHALLALTFLSIVFIVFLYVNAGPNERIVILRMMSFTLILSDVFKTILIACTDGVKVSDYLPLEACSFGAYACFFDSLWPNNGILPLMLLTLFMPAAFLAVIFPTTTDLPVFNFYTIHQFLYHALIVAYGLARFAAGEVSLTFIGVWKAIAAFFVLAMIMYLIDTVFDKNFMFLRDAYGNALLSAIWKITGGGIAYVGGLFCFSIFVIHVFFLLFRLIEKLFL